MVDAGYDLSVGKICFHLAGEEASDLQVLHYRGSEGLSQLYRFDIQLVSPDAHVALEDHTGRAAALSIDTPEGRRWFHGVIAKFEATGEGNNEFYYRVELAPTLWLLTHRYFSRIFQHETVPAIVRKVLTRAGITSDRFDLALAGSYSPRTYCVQYRETDFNFISRLMEEEGIFYYFTQSPEGEKLVVADSSSAGRPIESPVPLPFHPSTHLAEHREHVFAFRFGQEVRPGSVVLRDFNYEKPRLDLQAKSDAERDGGLEFSDYPGEYDSQAAGWRVAKIRMEEFECRRQMGEGQTNCSRLAPGRMMALADHPRPALNRPYLLTRVCHEGRQVGRRTAGGLGGADGVLDANVAQSLNAARQQADGSVRGLAEALIQVIQRLARADHVESHTLTRWLYHAGQIAKDPAAAALALGADPLEWLTAVNTALAGGNGGGRLGPEGPVYQCRFECIPAEVRFRPPRATPWPVMRGCQTATVVGPEGEEIYTDEQGQGRVKVQFHWDREGRRDEHSSCWVRVSQPWAGEGWGAIFLPRIGQEVIVDFLEGGPDRPVIVGRVYNGVQRPPYELPEHKTQSGIQTRSTPEGTPSNFNEIKFEDLKGHELLYVQAEKDRQVLVKHNNSESVGNNESVCVGSNRSKSVGANETTSIGADRTESVGGNETIAIGANRTETVGANEDIAVAANRALVVGANSAETVGANETRTVGANQAVAVGSDQSNRVGSQLIETVGLIRSATVGVLDNTNVGVAENINAGIAMLVSAGVYLRLQGPGGSITIDPSGITISGKLITIEGATVNINP